VHTIRSAGAVTPSPGSGVGRPIRLMAVMDSLGAGGAERIMAILTQAWAARGWEIELLLTAPDPPKEFVSVDPSVRVRRLGLYRGSGGLVDAVRGNVRRVRQIRSAIRAGRPDLVLSFLVETNVLTILASRGLAVPVIVEEHIHSPWPPMRRRWRLLRLLTYPMASSVVALTPSALAALGLARGRRGRVIPNPVMAPPIGSRNPKLPPTIVAIGRLVPQKGFDMLLAAFARVARRHPGWHLEIWGEGPDLDALGRQRDELGLAGRVAFPGRTEHPYDVLRDASMFVMSSRREGFPTVLGEAMACGAPVVSFDCPSGPGELIRDEVDGLLVPPEDVEALAAGMERLIGEPGLATRLASRAPEVVDRFSLHAVLELWDDAFSGAAGRSVWSQAQG
jgi:GalNAc-alpha-(1->4)-GalNAc-alpha-(1->3)-diNAcBac-PP-undecaprenol alpha-1,4-N-acetyl-D-galactosaminyltransferase